MDTYQSEWNNTNNSTTFQLYALGANEAGDIDSSSISSESGVNRSILSHDADAVFYVKLSDMLSVFRFQTPTESSNGPNDISLNQAIFDASSNIRYYVFRNHWPTSLKINPSHAMLDRGESSGMLNGGDGSMFGSSKSLVKHDFIRYLSLRLFNTIYGVDFFKNEEDLLENIAYYGEVSRVGIMAVLDTVSTLSADISMPTDASANRYLTNSTTTETNISRELLRQIAIHVPERLSAIDGSGVGGGVILSVPFIENDTLNIRVVMEPSPNQHTLTNVNQISGRSYNIKLILKNSIEGATVNTSVVDSLSFPNGSPYTTNVQDISASNLSVAASVYADKSPPVPIPIIKYGYQGWYYTNSSLWVNPAPSVRNKINWYLLPNVNGGTTVERLRYIRLNLHIFNVVSTPFITVYTQATGSGDYGGWYKSKRTYIPSNVSDDGNPLSDNTNYCFYTNWNGYSISPFTIAHTNAAMSLSGVSGSNIGNFGNNEVIFAYSIGTNSTSTAGTVEFILSASIIGEANTDGSIIEKEYGYIM